MQITSIDTRQGTDNSYRFSHGNALPLTGVPFAMNYYTVQNDGSRGGWFFNPNDHRFEGFRLTHQPSPWVGDFSHLVLLPLTQAPGKDPIVDYAGSFEPNDACFNPAQLRLYDLHYGVESTLIPNTYGATIKSCFPQNQRAGYQLTLPGRAQVDFDQATNQLNGQVINFSDCEDPDFTMYFSLQLSAALDLGQIQFKIGNEQLMTTTTDQTHFSGDDLQLIFYLQGAENELALATSFISPQQARLNLRRQQTQTFTEQQVAARHAWQTYFDRIEIEDHRHQEQVKTFYTTLYRLFLFPQKFYELDEAEQPCHYDTLARTSKPGILYTNNGFWDTYKTVYPFYSLIAPEVLTEMLRGFLTSYREAGFLPKWLSPDERGMMPGTLIDAVIADAASKDLLNPDQLEDFLTAMVHAATVQSDDEKYGRRGTLDYLKYGYVPDTHEESVNHTLDYAYSDYCIAVVAEKAGHLLLAKQYRERARNYRHLFDPETGFMRPKDPQGEFDPDFRPLQWGHGFTEGSVWQNGFAVYQDIAGLVNEYGGKQTFYEKLVELVNQPATFETGGYGFEIHEMTELAALKFGQLALSNQPSFHIPYLFTYVGHPEMTQLLIKQLLNQAFNAGYQGFPGDEDNGSMAGWYVLSALGIYPVTPGSGQFVFGLPLFDRVTLHLPAGKTLVLRTKNNEVQNQFVQARSFNGQNLSQTYIAYDQLIAGGELTTTLGLAPSLHRSTNTELPYSISTYDD
ncbi:GH92 family glycosyl hydrolase [Lapidilactobacillus luobeiensis]|uniref:GH92 family glycosyl hydrolase n=1 Tax=Lapidilactobacillus luobeiensis TaxID=2950371 RepID=UPI0021C2BC3F|nr:GH92 family glycosyl hydrolase [Lapidilactobacillus luobeiensis]